MSDLDPVREGLLWRWFCNLFGPPLPERERIYFGQPEEWGEGRMT